MSTVPNNDSTKSKIVCIITKTITIVYYDKYLQSNVYIRHLSLFHMKHPALGCSDKNFRILQILHL